MIEQKPVSDVTRLALHHLKRIQGAELEEVAQAAAANEAPIADGWQLNAQTMTWQREVPDPPAPVTRPPRRPRGARAK